MAMDLHASPVVAAVASASSTDLDDMWFQLCTLRDSVLGGLWWRNLAGVGSLPC
jgi:hypothetical protein